jgi:ribokinase
MMDLVVRAPRLPAVGESLIAHSFETFIGGKGGNQATASARLGAEVVMIGRVGDDDFGRAILANLAGEGIDTSGVAVDATTGTGVAVPVVLDDGNNAILAVPRANLALTVAGIEQSRGAIESADILMVQFEVGMAATGAAMRIAREARRTVVLNPAPIAPHPAGLLALADVVIPNEVEAAALAPGAAGDHAREAEAILRRGAKAVVITLGERGALAATPGSVTPIPAFRVAAVDSVGAGDAFCGALAVAMGEGASLAGASRFAAAAAACSVTKPGAAASLPFRDEVDRIYNHRGNFPAVSGVPVDDGDPEFDTERGGPG